jgi:uncharacterized iron-regulated membrane protein
MRRFFKKIHLWLSIPSGLTIFIICITGAILSFETEILEAYYPERYFVEETKETPIPLNQLVPIINQQLKDNTVANIKVTSDPNRTYIASLTEGFRVSAFVDPYTGELKGIYSYREGFFFKIMSLHRWLMDGTRTWGKYTVGISTLLLVFITISGIVWWVPSKKKKLKSRLKIKTSKGIKRFLHDTHLALGIYACIFLLVCSLTGLMWSFDWYRNSVYKLFGAESPTEKKHGGRDKKEGKSKEVDYQYWNIALENLQEQVKNYKYIMIEDGNATILTTEAAHTRATDKYKFDNSNGTIGKVNYYSDQKGSGKIMSWAYALHVGAYGGIFFRILTCIACIIGATLPLTGYYMFYQKRRKKKKH